MTNTQNTPDKRVEEIQKKIYTTKHFDEIMPIIEQALTQHHQDLMSEVVERLEERKRIKAQMVYKSYDEPVHNSGILQGLNEAQTIIKTLTRE